MIERICVSWFKLVAIADDTLYYEVFWMSLEETTLLY